jgi:hypothetical protein
LYLLTDSGALGWLSPATVAYERVAIEDLQDVKWPDAALVKKDAGKNLVKQIVLTVSLCV